jgi:hypothetical protein
MPPRSQTCLTFLGISVQSAALVPLPRLPLSQPHYSLRRCGHSTRSSCLVLVSPPQALAAFLSSCLESVPSSLSFHFVSTSRAFFLLLTPVSPLLYLTFKNFISSFDRRLDSVSFFLPASEDIQPLLIQSYLFSTALGCARLIPGHSNVSPDQSPLYHQ